MSSQNPYLLTLPQLISAKKKIGRVAAFHDPMKTSFSGFDSEALDPTQFREQMRRNLMINLTDAELGAIVTLFDKDGDRLVDTVEFLNEYFRLGASERLKLKLSHEESTRKIQQKKKKFKEKRDAEMLARIQPKVTDKWKPEDEKSAVDKISRCALSYDRTKMINSLRPFMSCGPLGPGEFREMLRQCFNVHLSVEENSALLSVFDDNNNGEIDCTEFVTNFFRLGRLERDRHMKRQSAVTRKKNADEAERKRKTKESYAQLVLAKVSPATEEDKASALKKIQQAAIKAVGHVVLTEIKAFEAEFLDPTAFRECLKQNFHIILSPGELDATIKMFDKDGDGMVTVIEFVTTFIDAGWREKRRIYERNRELEAEAKRREEERIRAKIERALEQVKTRVKWPKLPSEVDEEDNFDEDDDGDGDGDRAGGRSLPRVASSSLPRPSSSPSRERRRTRKPTMHELLTPYRPSADLMRSGQSSSLADLFPKASKDTKEFIREIESKEKDVTKRLREKLKAVSSSI